MYSLCAYILTISCECYDSLSYQGIFLFEFNISSVKYNQYQARNQGGGGAFWACAPTLSLMLNEKIYGD